MGVAQYPQLGGPFTLREQYIGQPAKIYASATQAIAQFTIIKANLDTVEYDGYGSSFNTTNNQFVAYATGIYLLTLNALTQGSLLSITAWLYKNGAIFQRFAQDTLSGANQAKISPFVTAMSLLPNDTLDMRFLLGGAATMFIGGLGSQCHFMLVQQVA